MKNLILLVFLAGCYNPKHGEIRQQTRCLKYIYTLKFDYGYNPYSGKIEPHWDWENVCIESVTETIQYDSIQGKWNLK